jgi:hypothetical protein
MFHNMLILAYQKLGTTTHGGSRFNIRFDSTPGSNQLTPAAIMKALREYVEFPRLAEGSLGGVEQAAPRRWQ